MLLIKRGKSIHRLLGSRLLLRYCGNPLLQIGRKQFFDKSREVADAGTTLLDEVGIKVQVDRAFRRGTVKAHLFPPIHMHAHSRLGEGTPARTHQPRLASTAEGNTLQSK